MALPGFEREDGMLGLRSKRAAGGPGDDEHAGYGIDERRYGR
jgi:hypothetical protein